MAILGDYEVLIPYAFAFFALVNSDSILESLHICLVGYGTGYTPTRQNLAQMAD